MNYFIKHYNNKESLIKEVQGLKTLRAFLQKEDISEVDIPEVIGYDRTTLTLQKIENKKPTPLQMQQFATALAKIHQVRFKEYGLSYDNFIGLNPQKNSLSQEWGAFFADFRLNFQIDLIKESHIRTLFKKILINNRYKLISFLNETCEHASLVHGDLWSGNLLFSFEQIYLIDPAIYYGDREVDIAMSEMFGGFSKEFYSTYDEQLPLSKAYQDKAIIYNLYHYLNHYNLFGDSYLHDCEEGLSFLEKL